MSPGSSSGLSIASFSFQSPARQPVPDSAPSAGPAPDGAGQPPSHLALQTVTTRITPTLSAHPARNIFSTLPTTLIHLIKRWLIDRESLQLLLTGRFMRDEVQSYYKLHLRPGVALTSVSPIASYQESVNCIPSILLLEEEGELTFQKCLAMKKSGLSEADYCSAVLQLLKTCVSESNDQNHLIQTSAGIALGLGGTLMCETSRSALFHFILGSFGNSTGKQMGALIAGTCCAFGGPKIRPGHLQMVSRQVLNSYKTSTPCQMAYMLTGIAVAVGIGPGRSQSTLFLQLLLEEILSSAQARSATHLGTVINRLCMIFCGKDMSLENSDVLISRIKASEKSCGKEAFRAMIWALCTGLGGGDISISNLDAILTLILNLNGTWNPLDPTETIELMCRALGGATISQDHRETVFKKIPLSCTTRSPGHINFMIRQLCRGLGGSTMSRENLDAVLTLVLGLHAAWSAMQMGDGIFWVCDQLGGATVSSAHRDTIVDRILASFATSSPQQMGLMLLAVCRVLGGANTHAPNSITEENLDFLISRILTSHQTSSPAQMGSMIYFLYRSLGSTKINSTHRIALVTSIQKSGRLRKIIAALKLVTGGQEVVNLLKAKERKLK